MSTSETVEHFFRREYSKLVATLSRRVGMQHMELVEDAVQSALMTALDVWPSSGEPANPTGWLFRVARNQLLDELRKRSGREALLEQYPVEQKTSTQPTELLLEGEIRDNLLRMLFICCDETIPEDSQLVLALKTLCGFSVREIGIRLFASEANVYKRLQRARTRLGDRRHVIDGLHSRHYETRLSGVHRIIYLIFTEGHLSSHSELTIRRDLCDEAIRLAEVLATHPVGQNPVTYALLALMHLHAARMTARVSGAGGLLLLEEQDRNLWDRKRIGTGMEWLAKSANGDTFSRYHAEAAIAVEHCLAPSFNQTRWDRIVENYELLERAAPSAVHRLNRAVAVAEWRGPAAGLDVLADFNVPTWLEGSYMWAAVLADLHRRAGNRVVSARYRDAALDSAPTAAVRDALRRRLASTGQIQPEPDHEEIRSRTNQ